MSETQPKGKNVRQKLIGLIDSFLQIKAFFKGFTRKQKFWRASKDLLLWLWSNRPIGQAYGE